MQGDGGFLKAGEVGAGSQCLMWDASDESWQFRNFGGPNGYDYPYKNKSDTPEPPPSGWVQYESCGNSPYPTVALLMSPEEIQEQRARLVEEMIEAQFADGYPDGAPDKAVIKVEGCGYERGGTTPNGFVEGFVVDWMLGPRSPAT